MTAPHDEWDDDERALLQGLHDEFDAVRLRHAGDPPLDVLAAADGDALPPAWQAQVQAHLDASAWSRALVDGAALPEAPLDALTEARILARATADGRPSGSARRIWRLPIMLSGALAASAVLAVLLWPRHTPVAPVNDEETATAAATGIAPGVAPGAPEASSPYPPPPPLLPFAVPEVRLQLSSLTWRGAADDNPYLQDLGPAVTTYRAGDYPAAAEAFTALMPKYPAAFEVHFYGGVSQFLGGRRFDGLSSLERAVELADDDTKAEALWFLAVLEQLSERAAERPAAFRARLHSLCTLDGPWAARGCDAAAAWRAYDAEVEAWREANDVTPSVPD